MPAALVLGLQGANMGFTSGVLEDENKTDLVNTSCTLRLFLFSAFPLGW